MLTTFKKLLTYAFLFYAFFGFIVLPFLLKPQLIDLIEDKTATHAKIETIYFNPFLFKITLDDFEITSLQDEPLVSFKSLCINLDPSSLVVGALHIKELHLETPIIDLVYNNDKSINLINIIKKEQEVKEDTQVNETNTEPLRIIVDTIEVSDGGVNYKDYTQKNLFEFSFNQIGFKIQNIDTKDVNSSHGKVRFYSTLGDGGFVDFKSNISGYDPLKVEGTLDFQASKLYSEWKYVKEKLKLEVADGKVSFHANYALNLDDINATLIDNVTLSLENLRVKPKEGSRDILNLKKFYVDDATILPLMQSVRVSKIGLTTLDIKAKRDKNGLVDWVEYTRSESKTSDTNETNEISTPWDVVVKEISLEKISLEFEDKMIRPQVTSNIDDFNVSMHNVTLAGEEPLSYKIDMLLNKKAKLSSCGTIIHKELNVTAVTTLNDFDVVHYKSYIDDAAKKSLSLYDIDLKRLGVDFEVESKIRKKGENIILSIDDANLTLNKLKINKNSTKENLAVFQSLRVKGIAVDTETKDVKVESLFVNGLKVKAQKYKNSKLNLDALVVPKKAKKPHKSVKEEKPFALALKHFALRDMSVMFTDNSLQIKAHNKIDKIKVDLYDIKSAKKSWLRYTTSLRVNSKGTIKTAGKLRHTPLMQSGTFDLNNISLTELTPYLQESMYLKVDDGSVSLHGKSKYSVSSKRADLRVESSFKLSSFFMHDSRDNSLLFSLNEVDTPSFTFELAPDRLYVNELNVNAFYVNAMIDEKKQLNFSKLMKSAKKVQEKPKSKVATKEKKVFPVQIVKTNVSLGSAKFADYSIPIKFKTHIHNLDGVIYSLTNLPDETTYVNIVGEVDEYGSTRLQGSVDSAKPKEFTDLSFSFKNLDLNSLSGYSATFAGHEIDSGKLYLDLDYDILNSELKGSNSVILKKVVLGKEIDDENVTVLPLGFVLGLLEDSDGIVDLDMKVEGNVDAPDFKYGPLVLKTITGLITKAVTSPFKFLGAVMGFDGEKLKYVEFEAGKSVITPPEREKLDQIAKIMLKKPKISLNIIASYDEKIDKEVLQLKKLINLVMKKSGLKNRDEHESVMSVDLLEEIYEDMKDDDALDVLKERLHKEVPENRFERVYRSKLIKLCSDIQPVDIKELEALADARSKSIILYLNLEKFIFRDRITNSEPIVSEALDNKLVRTKMEIEVK